MGPLILSRSFAKSDRRRPGDNGAALGPLPMNPTPAAPGQKRHPTQQPGHTFDRHEQAWKGAVTNQLQGLSAQCMCCHQCSEL